MIGAAISIRIRAAAISAIGQLAASIARRTSSSRTGSKLCIRHPHLGKRLIDESFRKPNALRALASAQIAGVSRRAAVRVIGAAISIWIRAATVSAIGKLAASVTRGASTSRTRSNHSNWLDLNECLINDNIGSVGHRRRLGALAAGNISLIARGAAMQVIRATIGARIGTAAISAIAQRTTCVA